MKDDDLVEPTRPPLPPDPPRKFDPYLREAALHALRVFPDSEIGRLIHDDLDFASRNEWSKTGAAMARAREIYRLQESGFVMKGTT